jgi:subtilase family serine protease
MIMKKPLFASPLLVLLILTALLTNLTPVSAASSHVAASKLTPFNMANYKEVPVCDQTAKGFVHCLAIRLQPRGPVPNIPSGLTPDNIQDAYNLPSISAGYGQTVAIIDAYDDPHAASDLATYRSIFGLRPCTTINGCFKKIDQNGTTNYPTADASWASEIALDMDMVSAIAPNSHILLVEANRSSFSDMGRAVNTAARLGATVISNSYGSPEDTQSAQDIASYYNHHGIVITASSGDNGYGVQLPAAFNTVVAVGGTSLSKANNRRGWNESAWNGSGSGCSSYISKPTWQHDSCSKRTITDVAAIADPATGVAVYTTYGDNGWAIYGGTSVSSPIIAATYALAGNAAHINGSFLYSHTSSLNDITSGKNGTCKQAYLCSSAKGYDGPTGLGTPKGIGAF